MCYLVHHLEFHNNSDHHITDDDLAEIIPDCPNLETTLLSGIPDLSDRTLVSLSHSSHDLRCIDISGCGQVTNVGIWELASHASHLEVIRLNSITILTDPSVSAIARSLPHLRELELCRLPLITASSVRDIWTCARQIRKLKLSRCPQLTDKAFPSATTPVPSPTRSSGTRSYWDSYRLRNRNFSFSSYIGIREKEDIIPRTTVTDKLDLPVVRPRPLSWLDEFPPLVLSSSQKLEFLRILDLSHCWRITDDAVAGVVKHAPGIQWLNLSGCYQLTNLTLTHLAMLNDHLDVLSIAHLDKITDRGVLKLARACSKLRSLDIACKFDPVPVTSSNSSD
ncbi:hypothetical protein NLI96_g1214 [Meripilus lineatus]|uniref:RNI-like protein n=1 Tax=Meripilus lineatus TaxID=2056292 RepID=A0AAD5VAS2_9APHY|nr:hypothetical protein NLI96_g1214 [Physisporinus lineatus]